MFGGLIECMGSLVWLDDVTLKVCVSSRYLNDLAIGQSVAINGVCLTIVEKNCDEVSCSVTFHVSEETKSKTTLNGKKGEAVAKVNVEKPLIMSSYLGGHFVRSFVASNNTF